MADPLMQDRDNSPLNQIREGMTAYDRNGDKIGKVKDIFFGVLDANIEEGVGAPAQLNAPSVDNPRTTTGAFDASLDPVRGGSEDLPEQFRHRLEREGYIRIDGGLLGADRFAVPGQIAGVEGDRVNLNVVKDQLLHT